MRSYVFFPWPFRGELLKIFVLEHIFFIRPIVTNDYNVYGTADRFPARLVDKIDCWLASSQPGTLSKA